MTYKELLEKLNKLTEEQLNCDVTVEIMIENECYPAELRICGKTHDSLDEDHPVIYVGC